MDFKEATVLLFELYLREKKELYVSLEREASQGANLEYALDADILAKRKKREYLLARVICGELEEFFNRRFNYE